MPGANYAESGRDGLEKLLAALAAALPDDAPGVIGLSMAGVGRPDIRGPALRDLDEARASLFAATAFYLFHDGQSAFWAAHPDGRGVVVSAGTGSFAIGADGRGGEARCGGWGRFASDEGSAWWIAIEALRRIMREVDGRERPSRMSELVTRRLALGAPIELVTWLHTPSRTKEEIAALSREVEEAAGQGDDAAARILAAAGAELANLTAGVLAQLDLGGDPEIVAAGSVLRNSAPVRASLEAALRARWPGAAVRRRGPAFGARHGAHARRPCGARRAARPAAALIRLFPELEQDAAGVRQAAVRGADGHRDVGLSRNRWGAETKGALLAAVPRAEDKAGGRRRLRQYHARGGRRCDSHRAGVLVERVHAECEGPGRLGLEESLFHWSELEGEIGLTLGSLAASAQQGSEARCQQSDDPRATHRRCPYSTRVVRKGNRAGRRATTGRLQGGSHP